VFGAARLPSGRGQGIAKTCCRLMRLRAASRLALLERASRRASGQSSQAERGGGRWRRWAGRGFTSCGPDPFDLVAEPGGQSARAIIFDASRVTGHFPQRVSCELSISLLRYSRRSLRRLARGSHGRTDSYQFSYQSERMLGDLSEPDFALESQICSARPPSTALITRRSRVRIPPPLCEETPLRRGFFVGSPR
jgi:hypothetical protein